MAGKDKCATQRRDYILDTLKASSNPVTATYFAEKLSVSRQIIVGDVALLRASGKDIVSTPRGYVLGSDKEDTYPYIGMLACNHSSDQLKTEMYTIVDYGATIIDVSIEHAIYGELSGKLNISSRYEVDQFVTRVEQESNSAPISILTGGTHLHRIGCKDKATFELIKVALKSENILVD